MSLLNRAKLLMKKPWFQNTKYIAGQVTQLTFYGYLLVLGFNALGNIRRK